MKTILLIQLSSLFLVCLSFPLYSEEPSNNTITKTGKTLFDDIRDFAVKMEIFPMELYAPIGPLAPQMFHKRIIEDEIHNKSFVEENPPVDWGYRGWHVRYELTFDRYIPMFEFKERVVRAEIKEIENCIDRIDEMTPKEKALLFTAFYIFESRYRLNPGRQWAVKLMQASESSVSSRMIVNEYDYEICYLNFLSRYMWDKWFTVVEQYKDSTTIAFPAFDHPLDDLKKEWKANYDKYKHDMASKWNILVSETCSITISPGYSEMYRTSGEKPPEEIELLLLYTGYQRTIRPFPGSADARFFSGNSSVYPKTLGEIAMQILMSRFPYDPDHPHFGNPRIR